MSFVFLYIGIWSWLQHIDSAVISIFISHLHYRYFLDVFNFIVLKSPLWPKNCACVHLCVLSHFSHVQLCVTLWTAACQAPLSMGFSRQEYWSRLPCLPPVDLPDPGIKPSSLRSPAPAGRFFSLSTSTTWSYVKKHMYFSCYLYY